MISSMTGFASRSRQTERCELQWDIRSLNHRALDLHVQLPDRFRPLEADCRKIIGARISRGRVDASLSFGRGKTQNSDRILDPAVLSELLGNIEEIRKHLPELSMPSALEILKWPDLFAGPDPSDSNLSEQILGLLSDAVEILTADRRREGKAICLVIQEQIEELKKFEKLARDLLPEAKENIKIRLLNKLAEINVEFDPMRMEQEIALILIKMDVSEEMDRIGCHIDELTRTLASESDAGRRMNFLLQELLREVNTCAAKSNHYEFTSAMVEMKVILEKIREQIQNIV